ncbi:hypothetical protein [Methylobacterium trifolii]|uniref:Uncharacterized protein n=1 Tax=Methylobacterium trifolii TaxID=1003092 RepID=A0ABQ4U1S4_9HYPH|nr:hypothetical protein [Methylobacterium trifolii]GJE59795.1 hypothetical protein MPOCJGCO_1897 [Methylobacterium trifolii]
MNFDLLSKNPAISLSGYFIGIVAFIFSIYTYEATKQRGQIYYASETKLIYAPLEPKVLPEPILAEKYQNHGRIYVTQFALWNGGNLSFEPQTQRTPIILSGDSNVAIFDVKIMTTKTITENNFTISKVQDHKYKIDWKVLDPEDGLKIQILHSGSPRSVTIEGKFAPNFGLARWAPSGFILPSFILCIMTLTIIHVSVYYSIVSHFLNRLKPWIGDPLRVLYIIAGFVLSGAVSVYLFYQIISYSGGISPFTYGFEGNGGMDAGVP